MTTEDIPRWPSSDSIFRDTVRSHNEKFDPSAKLDAEQLYASESITLILLCAVLKCALPEKYLLATRGSGIDDHFVYVNSYICAVKTGSKPSGKGTRIAKHIKRFAVVLGITPEIINQALLRHPLLHLEV